MGDKPPHESAGWADPRQHSAGRTTTLLSLSVILVRPLFSASLVSRLSEFWVADGCRFLLVYLLAYLLLWNAPLEWARMGFTLLHGIFIAMAVVLAFRKGRKHLLALALLGVLFVLLWIPGAYLEYPSDPWEHFRRIFTWEQAATIRNGEQSHRFTYFLEWTLLASLPLMERRDGLDLMSALFQWLVALQVYQLGKRLGFRSTWAAVATVAFFATFGTGPFSLRYYALASSALAYVAYLRLMSISLDFTATPPHRKLWGLLVEGFAWVAFIYFNHRQELAFLPLGPGLVLAQGWFSKQNAKTRRRFALGALWGGLFFLGLGIYLMHFPPKPFRRLGLETFTFFGGFHPRLLIDTLGVTGVVALLVGIVRFRSDPRLTILTLAPTVALLFPLSALAVAIVIQWPTDAYRLLYAFPLAFALTEGLRQLTQRLPQAVGLTLATTAIVVAGLIPQAPMRGRLYFQFLQPGPERELRALDQTILWLLTHRSYPPECLIATDSATGFVYYTHTGLPDRFDRTLPEHWGRILNDRNRVLQFATERKPCAFLVADNGRIPPSPPSPVASLSGHWIPEFGDFKWLSAQTFTESAEALMSLNWRRELVPPYFTLYEPPEAP